ncbi:MAG: UDP-3-O-(3-hydroxymyristoyl)glucosamine N-acyltransferase [Elusimicrobiaceae bacterium]|nr:UDP-3-O-(3-hydroxymyristoyl)glucosamine N-acyltransferase [Elusimicrobiaceae bacterium]MBP5617160.1 UDP-3-O-(3-hydroxymyristoyl)glucosamine N-acyltransferase [Elusimicrobiaceae bacterium]
MKPLSIEQITQITGAQASGGQQVQITALCALENAREGGVCYVTSLDKPEQLSALNASALFVPQEAQGKELPFKGVLLYAKNPEWAFILLMKYVDAQYQKYTPGIHPTAVISAKATLGKDVSVGAYTVIEDGVTIGDNTVIFPQCYIGKDVQIGKNCLLYPQVVIREQCVLKDYVILQAGATIGSDGFGFTFHEGRHQKIPQIGNVVLGNDVEIQSNTCIDRSKIASTVIGDNTKIDNLVQIGHNVTVGMSSIFCSQVGVAGTTQIGNGVILAGQVGLAGHMKIGDQVRVAAQAGVMNSIPAGQTYLGSPAMPQRDALKQYAILRKLPEMYKEFQQFQKEAADLKKMSFWGRLKKLLGR